jgi:hypothetical protein
MSSTDFLTKDYGEPHGGTVAVWFTSHYQIDSRDWDNIEEFGGLHHPVLGYYKSDDPHVLRQQLHWIRRAGIDVIVYDVFSTGKWDLTDLPKDRTLPLLLEALEDQGDEPRKLKLIIWLEKYLANPTAAEYEYALDYVREHLAEKDYYFRYNGKPLVVTFLNGENRDIGEIESCNDYFELRRIRPYYTDAWCYIDRYPQQLNREWICASPGSDPFLEWAYVAKHVRKETNPDIETMRHNDLKDEREGGLFYERQLLRARNASPNIIFISGWNDWQYSNQIEPALEYGFLYVDMTARILGRWDVTAPYRS